MQWHASKAHSDNSPTGAFARLLSTMVPDQSPCPQVSCLVTGEMSLTWIMMHHYALWWNLRNNFNNTLPFYNFSPSKAQRDNAGDTSDTTTQGLCIHLKRTSPHPNSVQSKALLQIFSVSLAPKIHFTWFMCQAPTKYSKSPQLSSQGAFCMLCACWTT